VLLLAQIGTKSFVSWGFASSPQTLLGELTGYSTSPDSLTGSGSGAPGEGEERREGEGKGEMRGESGHPRFSDGLTPLHSNSLILPGT